ncbi:UDP-N-acetylmuramate dehydrogenase [Candidatus Pelagibacter sp. HIMB1483]|uniref:UDP-N-acetylmuramate dehydrogenase n=1 Tax=Candidatus Pelagibacter sp. HIMB1483 TaxID=3415414 RepID=UPI003F843D96
MDERTSKINEMTLSELKEFLGEFGDSVKFEYDLKKKNWFNIGGKTKAFFKADNLKELVKFLKKINNKEKIFILGAGSNILVSDKLFDGIVIKLSKNFNNISLLRENVVIAGSAVLDKSLSDFTSENNLSGFEFLSCIPGTVGGGIKMNAGCFGKEFKDILLSIQAIDKSGNVVTIPSKDINFDYRKNDLNDDLIFLSASFKGVKSSSSKIRLETAKLKKKKEQVQPTKIKTSGSTFKNPISQTNKKVWELIKQSVPLDKTFGDASISAKHCNFFVNEGNATFNDMNNLIKFVTKKVFEKTGISLEKEIKILE